jgi:hypothetical protein
MFHGEKVCFKNKADYIDVLYNAVERMNIKTKFVKGEQGYNVRPCGVDCDNNRCNLATKHMNNSEAQLRRNMARLGKSSYINFDITDEEAKWASRTKH